jgi:hypothetical protein
MSKYAITIGSSHAYAMGLNATLNALDYYGVEDIDVYVFSSKFMREYFDYIKNKFNFAVYYIDAEELCPHSETHFADDQGTAWQDVMFFWGKYPLFHRIKDKYDAILHLDGDCMVTDNISDTFKITAETGNILIANNGRSVAQLHTINNWATSRERLLEFCKGHPVLNYVFFFDAKKYTNLIDYIWELRNDSEKNTKHFGLETAYFVQGLYDLNLLDKIVPLSFGHWISDDYLGKIEMQLIKDKNDKYHLIAPDGENIKVMHSRFWNNHITQHTIHLSDPKSSSRNNPIYFNYLLHNFEICTKMTDFLNYDWKSKLDEIVELNPHYGSFLNKDRAWDRVSKWLETPWPHI